MAVTLLKMVQMILSSMDGDEINSISDSAESLQVVDAIESTFDDLVLTVGFPEHYDFFELIASGDPSRPTLMSLPEEVVEVSWIKYDTSDSAQKKTIQIPRMPLLSFLDKQDTLDTDKPNVYAFDYVTPQGATIDIRGYNDRDPENFSLISDRHVVFDNFDTTDGQTLIGNRTIAYGKLKPVFRRKDDFVINLDAQSYSLLFNEAKSQAFIDIKQVQNAKADQRARRALLKTQGQPGKDKYQKVPFRDSHALNFGRRRSGRNTKVIMH